MSAPRPAHLRRCWLFLPGAEAEALARGADSGADVLLQELEDFTPPARRAEARRLAPEVLAAWRDAGVVAGARVNPLAGEGLEDLAAVMAGRPHIVALPKVAEPADVVELDRAVARLERTHGIAEGTTELLPNLESARGLVQAAGIARASPRVAAMLLASEDLGADLGAERGPDGEELAYARRRFLVECVAAGVVAVDCPYTFADAEGLEAEARTARRLGYTAKAAVAAGHVGVVNRILTPSAEEVARARRVVEAFEAARAAGRERVELDGALVEVPTYSNARRLLARAEALGVAG